jgi:hypothetical protein
MFHERISDIADPKLIRFAERLEALEKKPAGAKAAKR